MDDILMELYDVFLETSPQPALEQEICTTRQQLSKRLHKTERKLVLRIIDAMDKIADNRAEDAFRCGFWLAYQIASSTHRGDKSRALGKALGVEGGGWRHEQEPLDCDANRNAVTAPLYNGAVGQKSPCKRRIRRG